MNKPESSTERVKILVVDDNPKNIVAMSKVLSELDVELFEASSGEEALQMVLRHTFAVIFLDVQMPGMDGYEVAKCLAQNTATAMIPVVFVTAINNEQEHVIEGYASGAIDYLNKPINPEILLAKTKIFIRLYEQQQELGKLVKKLDLLANNDPLTGLSNRYQFNIYFESLLASSDRYNREFALLLLDLDNFKTINDSFGHDVGDALLKQAAGRLKKALRYSDHISRLGGDEFAILLPELRSAIDASHVARNLLACLAEPFVLEKHSLNVTTSIGVATYPFAGKEMNGLFKAADIALYRAKDKGKNAFEFYTDSLNEVYERQAEVEQAMLPAIENKLITLCYQPRVEMNSGRIIGVEALARWRDEKLGDISPVEFIRVAEEMGHMAELGKLLISQAFAQFKHWQKCYQSITFSLAINLSPYQFLNPNFIEDLRDLIRAYDVSLGRIEFELTESVFKGEDEELELILKRVCELGIQFSIDDFGTGYSSLSRLKLLPINILKIDRSFVRDIVTDPNDAAIVKAVIALAHALQLEVVAEGVETKEQKDFLLANGCEQAQGFYFSKPVSAAEIEVMLNKE